MSDIGIQYSYLSQRILAGRLNKARTEFLDKHDVEDDAIWSVAQFIENRRNGLPHEIFLPSGEYGYRITVERIDWED